MLDQEKISHWIKVLEGVRDVVVSMEPESGWTTLDAVKKTYHDVHDNLQKDVDFIEEKACFIFSERRENDDLTDETVLLLKHWYLMNKAPSLLSLCIFAAENFEIEISADMAQALVIAAVLGEVPNNHAYHSTLHYKKVLLQMIRLITIHNDIYQDTDNECKNDDITFLMMAACIHDLGHDGKGNTVKGVYQQARLERLSYLILMKYFNAIGFADQTYYKKMMDELRVVLLTTDTSPMGDPASFVNQMKSAYRHHFLKTGRGMEGLNLDPEIQILESDPKLTVMALLLHEADMATSSGLEYDVTTFETRLFYREIGQEEAYPSNVLEFLNTICQRQVLSSAGQKLYSANMARILALAEKDIRAGNEPYPQPEHSKFLLFHGEDDAGEGSKTIN